MSDNADGDAGPYHSRVTEHMIIKGIAAFS